MSADEPEIEIEIRRGMVAAVRTKHPVGAIPYQVVDYDTDGADDENTDVDAAGDRYTSETVLEVGGGQLEPDTQRPLREARETRDAAGPREALAAPVLAIRDTAPTRSAAHEPEFGA